MSESHSGEAHVRSQAPLYNKCTARHHSSENPPPKTERTRAKPTRVSTSTSVLTSPRKTPAHLVSVTTIMAPSKRTAPVGPNDHSSRKVGITHSFTRVHVIDGLLENSKRTSSQCHYASRHSQYDNRRGSQGSSTHQRASRGDHPVPSYENNLRRPACV